MLLLLHMQPIDILKSRGIVINMWLKFPEYHPKESGYYHTFIIIQNMDATFIKQFGGIFLKRNGGMTD